MTQRLLPIAMGAMALVIGLGHPIARAQSGVDDARNARIQQLSNLAPPPQSDYLLGVGDLIEVSVFGVPDYANTAQVSADGTIRLPLLEPVAVAGLSTSELEVRLESLLDGSLIRNPNVSVHVREHRSQSVFVMGAVGAPGEYQLSRTMRLIDLLAMAGGLQAHAGDAVSIQRRMGAAPAGSPGDTSVQDPNLIWINLDDLLDGDDRYANFVVQAGDVVHVPQREEKVYYVIGEVNVAGAFRFGDQPELLVSQAIANAGGPSRTAKASDGVLVRHNMELKTREEVPIDFEAILRGKKPDVVIRPDDIVFIPGSTFKTFSYGLLGAIPNTFAQLPQDIVRR